AGQSAEPGVELGDRLGLGPVGLSAAEMGRRYERGRRRIRGLVRGKLVVTIGVADSLADDRAGGVAQLDHAACQRDLCWVKQAVVVGVVEYESSNGRAQKLAVFELLHAGLRSAALDRPATAAAVPLHEPKPGQNVHRTSLSQWRRKDKGCTH